MSKTLIVDSSHLFFRVLFSNLEQIKENENFLLHVFLNSLFNQIKKHLPQEVILALDSSYSWRKDFYKENIINLGLNDKDPYWSKYIIEGYKGHRRKDTTVNFTSLFKLMDDLYEVLNKNSDLKCIRIPKTEGDDVIGVLTKNIKNDIVIISSDKDFVQLCKNKYVKIYDPMKFIFIDNNINIENLLQVHILIGDKSDNIPPVQKKMGPKTATKIIPILDKTLSLNPSLKKIYDFNKTLIDLECIPEPIQRQIIEYYNSMEDSSFQFEPLFKFCQKYNLREISAQLSTLKLKNKDKIEKQPQNTEETLSKAVAKLF